MDGIGPPADLASLGTLAPTESFASYRAPRLSITSSWAKKGNDPTLSTFSHSNATDLLRANAVYAAAERKALAAAVKLKHLIRKRPRKGHADFGRAKN